MNPIELQACLLGLFLLVISLSQELNGGGFEKLQISALGGVFRKEFLQRTCLGFPCLLPISHFSSLMMLSFPMVQDG